MRVCLLFVALLLVSCATSEKKSPSEKSTEEKVKKVKVVEKVEKKEVEPTKNPLLPEPPAEPEKVIKTLTCKGHDSERVVTLLHVGSNGCRVDYLKNGRKLVMAKDIEGKNYCDSTYDKVVGTLKAAGFTCKGK
jgi:hypothetical protein